MTPGRTTDARDLPVGPAVVPHRKNAAERLMWLAAAPLGLLLRAVFFASSRLRG